METRRFIYLIIAGLVLNFWTVSEGFAQSKPGMSPPVILHSFSVERGPYGYVWRIYLEAEDPDGDMVKIASLVSQLGYGYYPPDWIMIKPQHRKHLKGYIQWNTYSSKTHFLREWTQIALQVSIFDKAGNESNVVVFPFEFVTGTGNSYPSKLPSPFDQGTLPKMGNIFIDLIEPTLAGNGGKRND